MYSIEQTEKFPDFEGNVCRIDFKMQQRHRYRRNTKKKTLSSLSFPAQEVTYRHSET